MLNWKKMLAWCVVLLVAALVGLKAPAQAPNPFAVGDDAAFFALLDLARPELAGVKQAAQARDWAAAQRAWAKHLETRTSPQWLWSRRDKARIIQAYQEKFGGMQRTVPAADKVLARDFDFLGVRKKLDKDVAWIQGANEWTNVLSRFGYWRDLGYAWWATGNPAYARDFVDLLTQWVTKNPVPPEVARSYGKFGTVWRTLETGIRASEWFNAMELFMDAPEFDPAAKTLMTRSLVEHARRLYAHETTFRQGNWQVVECTGLATIGIMLPEFKEAAAWRERAFKVLAAHMEKDVYPDGAHHEVTPGYHSWVMMRYLETSLLCQRNNVEAPGLMARHEKMFEFLEKISFPDRRYPPLGDGGLGQATIENAMGVGALVYGRADMRWLGPPKCAEDWLWLFGPEVFERYAKLPARPPAFNSVMLPGSKYLMMRTGWQAADKYLLLDCAPWGGGHSHQDRLQVIAYAGRPLLVDPGMYSYDQPLSRRYLRKSEAHNVVMIDGKEQPNADPQVLAWDVRDGAELAVGRIAEGGLAHQRTVLFVKPDYWVVVDHLFGTGEHEAARLFHFPLDSGAAVDGAGAVATAFKRGMNMRVLAADGAPAELIEGWLPTGAATAARAPVAVFRTRGKLPLALCTVLTPFKDAQALPKVTLEQGGDPLTVRIRVSDARGGADEIAIAEAPRELTVGGKTARGRALLVRNGGVATVLNDDKPMAAR